MSEIPEPTAKCMSPISFVDALRHGDGDTEALEKAYVALWASAVKAERENAALREKLERVLYALESAEKHLSEELEAAPERHPVGDCPVLNNIRVVLAEIQDTPKAPSAEKRLREVQCLLKQWIDTTDCDRHEPNDEDCQQCCIRGDLVQLYDMVCDTPKAGA